MENSVIRRWFLFFTGRTGLSVNGDNDTMAAIPNSLNFDQHFLNSKMVIWRNFAHGALYRYHKDLVNEINKFMKNN